MARDYARVRVDIWADDDFRDLPPHAQHLYFLLLTSPSLNYCGVCDWRPGRIAALAAGWSAEDVAQAGKVLADRSFVVIDEETEEVLVRSFVRHDGLMKEARVAVSMANAHAAIASATIRGVIVHELRRLHAEAPDLAGWRNTRGEDGKALEVLSRRAVDPADLLEQPRVSGPVGGPLAPGLGHGLGQSGVQGLGLVWTPTSPAPTPTPTPPSNEGGVGGTASRSPRRKPEIPLPADWQPNDKHRQLAQDRGVDLDHEAAMFRAHAETHDRRARSWNGAFTTWLGKATPTAARPAGPRVSAEEKMLADPDAWRAEQQRRQGARTVQVVADPWAVNA